MPRSNRPRGRKPVQDEDRDFAALTAGWRRTETRGGFEWNVQPVSAVRAVKTYVCPGCGNGIAEGVAHVVVWRADGLMGESADLSARRHWHLHCWKIG